MEGGNWMQERVRRLRCGSGMGRGNGKQWRASQTVTGDLGWGQGYWEKKIPRSKMKYKHNTPKYLGYIETTLRGKFMA